MGKKADALAWIKKSYEIDPFNYGCMFEEYLLTGNEEPLNRLITLMHGNVYNFHELALDYNQAYLYQEAEQVLTIPAVAEELAKASPLTYYYIGDFLIGQGKLEEGKAYFEKAELVTPNCCFPNRLEDVNVLTLARNTLSNAARAPYYLGCLFYDKRQYDLAKENWELSAQRAPSFPSVWRNLALYYYNNEKNQEKALECMERAFNLDPTDSRILMELDQLYKVTGKPHAERLTFLEQYPTLIAERDDLLLEQITLLNQLGRYDEAIPLLDGHIFHPWEGGEGKVPAQYQYARVEKAKQLLASGNQIQQAITLLEECLEYPHHLGEGKLYGAQESDFYYFLGCAYEQQGDMAKANRCWEQATLGPTEPAAAMYYNDAKPEKIFYQGLALQKLGRTNEANGRFYKLVNYGKQHIFEKQTMDYFAVSLPDLQIWDGDLDLKNRIHCLFMLALGFIGLGEKEKANRFFREVEQLDINHQGVMALRNMIKQ